MLAITLSGQGVDVHCVLVAQRSETRSVEYISFSREGRMYTRLSLYAKVVAVISDDGSGFLA